MNPIIAPAWRTNWNAEGVDSIAADKVENCRPWAINMQS